MQWIIIYIKIKTLNILRKEKSHYIILLLQSACSLLEDGCVATIGPMGESGVAATHPLYSQAHIPQMSFTPGHADFYKSPYLIQVSHI